MRAWLFLCVLLPCAALAHQVGVSRSTWTQDSGRVTGAFVLANSELNALTPAALEKVVADGVALRGCTRASSGARPVEADGVEVTLTFDCAAGAPVEVDVSALLARLGSDHRHLAEFSGGEAVLRAGTPRFTLAAVAGQGRSTGDIIVMGVEHILSGPDHLLFLLGLLLGVRRLRDVLFVATAFTLGHSVTLSVATLGWYVPPSRVIEPLIALSLVWVGVENVLRAEPRGRWRIAGSFGLIHGFGFASALRDLHLPEAQLGWALFGFNAGVELGQLLVLAPLVPLLRWARKNARFQTLGTKVLSAGVAAAGLVWFVLRVGGWG